MDYSWLKCIITGTERHLPGLAASEKRTIEEALVLHEVLGRARMTHNMLRAYVSSTVSLVATLKCYRDDALIIAKSNVVYLLRRQRRAHMLPVESYSIIVLTRRSWRPRPSILSGSHITCSLGVGKDRRTKYYPLYQ